MIPSSLLELPRRRDEIIRDPIRADQLALAVHVDAGAPRRTRGALGSARRDDDLGVHVTLARGGSIERHRGVHHAVHGALRSPRRAGEADARRDNTPSLAESWTMSKDGLTYEFVLRVA